METLRWDSCGSQEAPPHRISSSVIARDQDPTLTSVRRPTQTGRPLQVSGLSWIVVLMMCCQVIPLSSLFSSHISAPGVFRCVRPSSSLRSLTHLGSPGWVVMEITATPDPWPPVKVSASYLRGSALHLHLDRNYPPPSVKTLRSYWRRTFFLKKSVCSQTSEGLCVWAAPLLFYICAFFILLLVEHTCFLSLHAIICKLLLITCLAHIACSDYLDGIPD